jgi:hypothetical protein
MTDPIRWCNERSHADGLEREVLRSELDVEPPANLSALVWGKLAGELGLGSALVGVTAIEAVSRGTASGMRAAGVAATPMLPAAGSSLAFVQGVVVGVLACSAVWAGVALPGVRTTAPPTRSPRVVAVASGGAPARASADAAKAGTALRPLALTTATPPTLGRSHSSVERASGTEASNGIPAPSVATFGETLEAPRVTAPDHQSQLKEEADLLRQARAKLRAGELANALELLDESKRRFAAPELYQEREALLIELLARTGRTTAAAERARVFLRSFPESPHADRLRAFAN